jgi:opacity protein-like surface antigen
MKLILVAVLLSIVAITSTPVRAQEEEPELAKIELFTGYAYLRADSEHGRANLNGWTISVEGNLNRTVALVADFDGTYRSGQSSHSALFGPKVTARPRRFAPFVHALAGVVREAEEGHVHYGFGLGLGGGVDYDLNSRFSLRLAQLDYEYSRVDDLNHNNFRFATGVVIKFGRK